MRIEEHDSGIAVLIMDEPHANAVTPDFIAALDAAVSDVSQRDPRALVVTAEGSTFSPGLALPFLVDWSREQLSDFMTDFGNALYKLLAAPFPTVAAVNGHAIAGGCVIALMCDRRVMAEGRARIGLTEVQLGVSLPSIVTETAKLRMPPASAAEVLMGGNRVDAAEAARLGLVDQVVPVEEVLPAAQKLAESMIRPGRGYAQLKADFLAPALEIMRSRDQSQLDGMMDTWFSDEAQQLIRAVIASLQSRS